VAGPIERKTRESNSIATSPIGPGGIDCALSWGANVSPATSAMARERKYERVAMRASGSGRHERNRGKQGTRATLWGREDLRPERREGAHFGSPPAESALQR